MLLTKFLSVISLFTDKDFVKLIETTCKIHWLSL